jgi:Alginate lyase
MTASSPSFAHPGGVFNKDDLPKIIARISHGSPMMKKAYANLSAWTPLNYKPNAKSGLNIGWNDPGGMKDQKALIDDSQQAYLQALMFVLSHNECYARNVLAIVNAWSTINTYAKGKNMPLEFAWSQASMARGMELVKYTYKNYCKEGVPIEKRYIAWLDKVVMPQLNQHISWTNNWVVSIAAARMQIAIFRDDRKTFYDAIADYKRYLPMLINPSTGLPTEVARDLVHTQFTLGSLANMAALAKHQGVNLYNERDGLLRKGFEMTASIIQGQHPEAAKNIQLKDVRFIPAFWEVVYQEYAVNQKKSMSNTKSLLEKKRPEWYVFSWGASTVTHFTG